MLGLSVAALVLAAPVPAVPAVPARDPEPWFGMPVAGSTYYWPIHVLGNSTVEKVLEITSEQEAKVKKIRAELVEGVKGWGRTPPDQREKYGTNLARKLDKAALDVLTEKQRPRYRQIVWQVAEYFDGVAGMAANPVFADALGLSADQKKKAAAVAAEYETAVRAPGRNTPPAARMLLRQDADEAALKLLTADQKKKWDDLLGEPVKEEIRLLPGAPPVQPPKPKSEG